MKKGWKKIIIKDIASIKKGDYITKKESKIGPYPVILGGQEPAYYINKYNHQGRAIVISRSGVSAGYVSFWNENIYVTDGFIIEPKENISFEYLYYLLKSKQNELHNMQRGAAIPHVTPALLYEVNIELPPFATREKIGSILRNYDNLIEYNQKQIKLLEEATQCLYKEWFVDLRFPGYDRVAFVDGLPSGWKYGMLGDIAVFKRGKTITKAQVSEGNVPVIAGGLEPAYYHNKANTVAPVITVSGSGANAGFSRLYNTDVFASDCSFADAEATPYLYFVYCFLKENKASLDALKKGSAQPHVYAKEINLMKLKVPAEECLNAYCKYVSPYFERIKVLQKQIELLSQARDRLLPKLISGELEV